MQVDLRDAVLTVTDGTPQSVIVTIGEGNLTFSQKRNIEYKLDRGRIKNAAGTIVNSVREGDEVPCEVSFEFVWDLEQTSGVYFEDAIMGLNDASAWVTTGTDVCEPYAVDLTFAIAPACGAQSRSYLFSQFRHESMDCDSSTGQVSCTGKSNEVHPTVT